MKVSTVDVGNGPAGFDPLDLPGCYFWFRADQISGPSNGDNITAHHTVPNEGASGGLVHSSTSSEQPTYTASAINSKPAITFDGSTELLKLSTEYDVGGACNLFDEDFGSDFTVMIVCRPHDVSDNSQRIFGLYSSTNITLLSASNERNHLWMGIKSQSKFSICGKSTSGDVVTAASAISDNEAHIFTAVYDQSETKMFLFQDGHLSASNSAFELGNGSGVSGNTTLNMGAVDQVGGKGGGAVYRDKFDGDIAEILIYDRKMSERNLTKLHHYLGKKYAINTKSGRKSISRY